MPHLARGINGRFVPNGEQSDAKARRCRRRKERAEASVPKQKELFERFMDLFFLVGKTNIDWIPTSSTNSPLFTIFESLIQPKFLLSLESRKERLSLAFFGGDPANVEQISKRVATRDPLLDDEPVSHVRAFDGRRLPQISNYSTEVEPIRAWLESCHAENVMRPSTVEESFSVCIREIGRYVLVSPDRRIRNQRGWNYHGFPRLPVIQNRQSSIDSAMEVEGNLGAVDSEGVVGEEEDLSQQTEQDQGQGETDNGNNATSEKVMDERVHEACELFESAINDDVYMTVSVLFDEDVGYHCVAAGYVEVQKKHRKEKVPVTPLMEDILTYSHWKCFRVKNEDEHKKREDRLLETKEVFDKMRNVFDMRTYSEMQWNCEERAD